MNYNTLKSTCISQLRTQRVSTTYHGSLISLYLCLQIVSGSFQVHSPRETMVAMLGGEAELHCFLLPPQNVKNMKISWTRFLPSQVVHLYEDGRDKPEETNKEYFGRTQLITDSMHKGVVRLKISNVQQSDSGQYRCAFQHDSFYGDALIMLKMAVLGSRPQLHMEVTESRQIQVVCKSEGWYPQPDIQWIDSEGRKIQAKSETHTQDKNGLFHVTSLLYRETEENMTCSIWNPILNQKKEGQLPPAVAVLNNTILIETIIALTVIILIILIFTGLYPYSRESLDVSCHRPKTQIATATTTTYVRVLEHNPAEASADLHRVATAKGISAVHSDQEAASINASGTAQAEGIDATIPDQEDVSSNASGTAQAEGISAAHPDQDAASANASGTAQAEGIDAANPDRDDTTVNTSGNALIPMEAPNASNTANVKHQLHSKYDTQKEVELCSWIEGLTGQSIGPDFQKGLKDGIILCTLMNKLQPGSIPKINQHMQNHIIITWKQLENLSNFNKAMASFGIDSMDLFHPNDLFKSRNMTQVQVSLLALKRKAKTKGL